MIMKYWEEILGEKSPPHSSFSFFVLWAATPQRSLLSQTFDVLDRKLSSLKEKEMVAAHGCFSYFSLQTMGKTPTRNVFRPEVWYSLETVHNRPCITGFKGSGSLYQCNKSEGRCLHVCQQHALYRRAGNQTGFLENPSCLHADSPAMQLWFSPSVKQPCTLIKPESQLQILDD